MENHLVDVSGLYGFIKKNPDNAFIALSGRGSESPENPLALLHARRGAEYFLMTREDGLIVASATIDPCGKDDFRLNGHGIYEAALIVGQVSVHPDHRGNKYGVHLLNQIFDKATQLDLPLVIPSFEKDGQRHLMPVLPIIHKAHPQVRVYYDEAQEALTGEKDYTLENNHGIKVIPALSL